MDHALLAEITLWLLAVLLTASVVLDGFDLGVGVLCLLESDEKRRASMMASIEGVWHANQTWLIVTGSVLFGGFPLAYGTLLSALYLPLAFMLLALMARGVGLEYYEHGTDKRFWSTLFGLGSLATALVQGAMLGAVVQGLPVAGHVTFASPFAWAGSGAALGALAMACLATLLGAGWVNIHMPDFSQKQTAMLCALGSLVFQAGLALTAPVSGLVPLLLAAVAAALLSWSVTALDAGKGMFVPACLHAALCLVAWLLALRPGFAAPGLTPLTASAAPGSLRIMLWGYAFVLPAIIVYSIYQYRVFKGQGAYAPGQEP